jgi:arylsulfatase A-like enzyme
LQAVHLPSFPGKDFKGKTKAGPHGDFIFEFDYIVGKLLDKLEALGLAEDTLVIVSSDNGPEVGTVISMREQYQHDGANPWRGVKRDNWEGGHRVPMIARWLGKVEAGSTTDQTVCLTDIMATCAAIADAELPNNAAEDSFNILPILLGEATENIREFTLHQTIRLDLAIRSGDWKYLDHKGSGGNRYERENLKPFALPDNAPDAPGQLYNLAQDPGETHNLYFEYPEVAKKLKYQLKQFKTTGRSAPIRR